ncbi:hypothetical protein E2C01_087513 [Portunus trituberculatus]|uniref:Uncharacterized protein n=1 Tax=Portunus trituberculatus TaxID=210409 RepID=A0A5B7JJG7_PORTR|nr:hypothetical protein [Portunus trituberculatus]
MGCSGPFSRPDGAPGNLEVTFCPVMDNGEGSEAATTNSLRKLPSLSRVLKDNGGPGRKQ